MTFGQILFSFSGRVNRAKWWLAVVFWTVVWTVAVALLVLYFLRDFKSLDDLSNLSGDQAIGVFLGFGIWLVLLLVVAVVAAVSGIAVGIKRLHDRDKSGWWLLLFYGGPMALEAVRTPFDTHPVSVVLSLAGFAITVWGIIELGFLRGTPGPNQYGPNPLAQPAPA